MSRVFDQNTANVLTAAVGLNADRAEWTMIAWIKADAAYTGGTQQFHVLNQGFNNPALRLQPAGSDPAAGRYASTSNDVIDFSNLVTKGTWTFLAGRSDGTRADLRVGGTDFENVSAQTALASATISTLRIGSGDSLDAYGGKVAHVAAWTRRLSDAEIASLAGGANPLTITGSRWYYYPLTDASLTNEFTPDNSDTAGSLTVNGTVTSDTGDNPTVDAPPGGSAPTISSVNGGSAIARGATGVVIAGTDLGAVNSVTIGGVAQTGVSAAATEVTFNLVQGGLKYGTNYTLEITDGTNTDTATVQLTPPAGYTYFDVAGLPWGVGEVSIFDGASPAVANGDQAEVETTTSLGSTLTWNTDGTYTIDPPAGTHQFDARVWDATDSTWGAFETFTASSNAAPVVVISTTPGDRTQGTNVTLAATATDAEDGNISANISWSSNVDGALGTGASVVVNTLSLGAHTITASVTDSGGLQGTDTVAITIVVAPPAPVIPIGGLPKVFSLPDVTGLRRWVDYIPVQVVVPTGRASSYDDNGALSVDVLDSTTGLVAWVHYIPVYEVLSGTPWSWNDDGYVPIAAAGE